LGFGFGTFFQSAAIPVDLELNALTKPV